MSTAVGAGPVAIAARAAEEEPAASAPPAASPDELRQTVLDALANAGMRSAAALAERGSWSLEAERLVITVAERPAALELVFNAEARKVAAAAASSHAGRRLKLHLIAGEEANGRSAAEKSAARRQSGRAAEDPVVRRMQEKFGAEIRSVIDHRQKR